MRLEITLVLPNQQREREQPWIGVLSSKQSVCLYLYDHGEQESPPNTSKRGSAGADMCVL